MGIFGKCSKDLFGDGPEKQSGEGMVQELEMVLYLVSAICDLYGGNCITKEGFLGYNCQNYYYG